MDWLNEWIENDCKPKILELRMELEPYLDGTMKMGQREGAGDWEDITDQMVTNLRANIAAYEDIIAKHEASKS